MLAASPDRIDVPIIVYVAFVPVGDHIALTMEWLDTGQRAMGLRIQGSDGVIHDIKMGLNIGSPKELASNAHREFACPVFPDQGADASVHEGGQSVGTTIGLRRQLLDQDLLVSILYDSTATPPVKAFIMDEARELWRERRTAPTENPTTRPDREQSVRVIVYRAPVDFTLTPVVHTRRTMSRPTGG